MSLVETMFWTDFTCGASDTFLPGSAGPQYVLIIVNAQNLRSASIMFDSEAALAVISF